MYRIDTTSRAATRRALGISLLVALLLGLGAAAPAVLAAINCTGFDCVGTDGNDTMKGSILADRVYGFGGDDTISGLGANDVLYGDDQTDPALDGADRIFGGSGNDTLTGFGGADLLVGGRGNDIITAQEHTERGHPPGTDTIRGGRGNDTISAADGFKDVIECGPGKDYVLYDAGLDTVTGCEDKDAV
jgi:Ca2+-binding RTX toxin-like protein